MASSPTFASYGTPDVVGGFGPTAPLVLGDNGNIGTIDTSTFDPGNLLVDPTNTGDTGATQDVSTPLLPSVNNPETAGTDTLGAALSKAIDAGFSAWQLASQPKGTPKTVSTTVGRTTVVSGQPSALSSLFGTSSTSQQGIINLLIVLFIGLIIYKLVVK